MSSDAPRTATKEELFAYLESRLDGWWESRIGELLTAAEELDRDQVWTDARNARLEAQKVCPHEWEMTMRYTNPDWPQSRTCPKCGKRETAELRLRTELESVTWSR